MAYHAGSRVRIPELDGIRGLAILFVVIGHYFGEVSHGVAALTMAWIGVNMFFTLSGFLIGGILLDNRAAGNYFATFYLRRTCRIFPIYFLVVPLLLVLLHVFGAAQQSWVDPPLPAWTYLTYTQNFTMTYLGSTGSHWLLPTWSLAVEEQFYLLLPVVIYVVPARWLVRLTLILIASAPVLRAAFLWAGGGHELGAYVLLPCRWDCLFLGVLAALIWRDQRLWARAVARNGLALKLVSLVSVAATLAAAVAGHFLFHVLGMFCFAALCTAYLLLVISGAQEGKTMRSLKLQFLGTISYGLYLIHQPIAGLLHGILLGSRPDIASVPQVVVTLAAMGISVALAWLSWTIFESRIVRFGHRWNYESAPALVPAASLALG